MKNDKKTTKETINRSVETNIDLTRKNENKDQAKKQGISILMIKIIWLMAYAKCIPTAMLVKTMPQMPVGINNKKTANS